MRMVGLFFGLMVLIFSASAIASTGGEVLSRMQCPVNEPMGMVADGDFLWISDMSTRTYVKISKGDGSVITKIDAPGFMPTGIALVDGILLTADRRLDLIARRNVDGNSDLSPIPYYERWATGMTYDGSSLWVVDSRQHKVHKIDPEDGTTVRSFDSPAQAPTGIAFDGDYLWVADHGTDEIYRMDRENGQVVSIIPSPGPYPNALAVSDGILWVADYQNGQLYQVSLPGETPYIEEKPRKTRVSFTNYFLAGGDGTVKDLVSYVAIPREIPGQHILGDIKFTPEPQRIVEDKWGQRVAVFELGNMESGQMKQIRWDGDFALYQVRFHLDPGRIDAARLPAGLGAYLVDDKKYDIKSPVIAKLVEELTGDQTGYYARARSVYNHLTEVITYERSGGWNNAAAVLERGSGSCSEYTFALVALLRSAGIPARYVGALSERGDEGSFDDVFHRWAEAYFPGYGWVPIDANAGHGALPGERGSYFGGRSNRHVVTTFGGGASEYLEWTYNSHEVYKIEGKATLDIQPIARYRPFDSENEASPHDAPKVMAPNLTTATAMPAQKKSGPEAGTSCDQESCKPPWAAAIALLMALGIGLLIGRFRFRS
jgi:transglutaminase-like putative cysteine protease/outer membrane protein assembly factor BamB